MFFLVAGLVLASTIVEDLEVDWPHSLSLCVCIVSSGRREGRPMNEPSSLLAAKSKQVNSRESVGGRGGGLDERIQ